MPKCGVFVRTGDGERHLVRIAGGERGAAFVGRHRQVIGDRILLERPANHARIRLMEAGRRRIDIPYLFPRTLVLPERPPLLVYLDLNHWVSLAKVVAGHPDGPRYGEVFDHLCQLEAAGQAVFPISDSLIMEISKIQQYKQRRDLRDTIEILSGYKVLTSRSVVAAHELEAILDERLGPSATPVNTMTYLDWGVLRAFGKAGDLRVWDERGVDVTEVTRQQFDGGPSAFDALVESAQWLLQRKVLAGPEPGEEENELRSLGWDPQSTVGLGIDRAEQESEQTVRFAANPNLHRGRIRDAVSARELIIELHERFARGLADRGVDGSEFLTGPSEARPFFDAMPSFDVAVSLKTALHQNLHHQWTANDIHDIDALGSAVPYCDVVVTDKAMAATLRTAGLDSRLNTLVLARLEDLPDALG
jgi:hypothetical protein